MAKKITIRVHEIKVGDKVMGLSVVKVDVNRINTKVTFSNHVQLPFDSYETITVEREVAAVEEGA